MVLWIDTETGGVDDKINPILTLGLAVTDDDYKVIFKNEFKIKNKYDLVCEEKALMVNRINLEEHNKYALDPIEVILLFNKTIKKFFKGEMPLIMGHNINFDIGFIKQMYLREKKEFKYFRNLDTLQLCRFLETWGLIKPQSSKMDDLIKYFQITSLGKKHSALVDVLNNIKIAKILKSSVKVQNIEKFIKTEGLKWKK